jgi:CRP-like cAMP-binding protein
MPTNQLLNSMPVAQLQQLDKHLSKQTIRQGDVLTEANEEIRNLYFPLGSMVSLVTVLEDGTGVESATVGNEGMVGMGVFFGLDRVNTRAICQISGDVLCMEVAAFRAALPSVPALAVALGLYSNALLAMVSQGGACNALHPVAERLARWLLTISDRVECQQFEITQEFLSQMIAAQRPTVTIEAGKLRDAGLIQYTHGRYRIIDGPGLERHACECYDLIRRLYQDTFSKMPATLKKLSSEH